MSILTKFAAPGQDIWYDPDFKAVLEDHMTYLRNHPNTTIQVLEPNSVIKYRFDLYSLFRHYGIEQHFHWLVMRMNGFNSPIDDISHLESFLVPDTNILVQILSHYMSRNKVRGK